MSGKLKLGLVFMFTAVFFGCASGAPADAPADAPATRGGAKEECAWPPGAAAQAPPACPPDCFWDEKAGVCKPDRGVIVPQNPGGK